MASAGPTWGPSGGTGGSTSGWWTPGGCLAFAGFSAMATVLGRGTADRGSSGHVEWSHGQCDKWLQMALVRMPLRRKWRWADSSLGHWKDKLVLRMRYSKMDFSRSMNGGLHDGDVNSYSFGFGGRSRDHSLVFRIDLKYSIGIQKSCVFKKEGLHLVWHRGTYHPSMFDEFAKYKYWDYLDFLEEEYQREIQELDFEAFLNRRMERKKRIKK